MEVKTRSVRFLVSLVALTAVLGACGGEKAPTPQATDARGNVSVALDHVVVGRFVDAVSKNAKLEGGNYFFTATDMGKGGEVAGVSIRIPKGIAQAQEGQVTVVEIGLYSDDKALVCVGLPTTKGSVLMKEVTTKGNPKPGEYLKGACEDLDE